MNTLYAVVCISGGLNIANQIFTNHCYGMPFVCACDKLAEVLPHKSIE